MVTNRPNNFVRAKPHKISITETYCYKAQVQKHVNFQFEKAEGEIKIEFLYDGDYQDFRWKLRQFLDGLGDKSVILRKLKNSLERFFTRGLTGWLTKWLGLRRLWKWLVQQLLGKWQPDKKYFGIDAISDAAKYGKEYQTARAGYLVLRGYQQPNFTENWPEYKTLPIEIPINNAKQRLASSQKYVLSYKYELPKPAVQPVYVDEIKLTDMEIDETEWVQANHSFKQLHSEYDETLLLEIPLSTDMGQPNVNDKSEVSPDLVKDWWNQSKEYPENKNGDKQPHQEQIRYIHNNKLPVRKKLTDELQRLATDRGGYLLIYVDGLNLSEKDTRENILQDLKKELIGAAFQCKPFVPIFQPYYKGLGSNKYLFVVPVPVVPPRWYDGRNITNDDHSSHLQVFSLTESVLRATITNDDSERDIKKLTRILSALANTDGGSIFLEARPNDKEEELKHSLRRAIWDCHPPLA